MGRREGEKCLVLSHQDTIPCKFFDSLGGISLDTRTDLVIVENGSLIAHHYIQEIGGGKAFVSR